MMASTDIVMYYAIVLAIVIVLAFWAKFELEYDDIEDNERWFSKVLYHG